MPLHGTKSGSSLREGLMAQFDKVKLDQALIWLLMRQSDGYYSAVSIQARNNSGELKIKVE